MRRLLAPLAAALVLLTLLTLGTENARAAGPAPPPPTPLPTAAPTPLPTAAPTYHPTLQLSASTGARDTALVVVASDFPPNGLVTLSWDGAVLARGTTDDAGYLSLRTAVPHDAPDGPHEVRAVGPAHTAAGAAFTVAAPPAVTYHPALALDAAQGQRGAHVALAATGFAPNQDVRFYWDRVGGPDLGMVRADASGNADYTITIGQGSSVTDQGS